MGRVKLKIRRLESSSNRQVTYSKRRSGILKKAKQLSVLCDIDISLLMFSPTGKPTIFCGARSNIDEIISKFAQLSPQERAKRKLESLEILRKTFKKLDHEINIQEFLDASSPSIEELCNQARTLRAQLTEVHKKLSWWSNPEKIEDIDHIRQMEDTLRQSLNRLRAYKENFLKHQFLPFAVSAQFKNEIHLPAVMSGEQEGQPSLWLPNNESQQVLLTEVPNFITQRDIDCSPKDATLPCGSVLSSTAKEMELNNAGQLGNVGCPRDLSRPSCSVFFGTRKLGEADDFGNTDNAECSKAAALPSCSGFLNNGKEIEIGNTTQLDNITHEGSAIDDLNAIACLRLQLGGQQAYYPYSSRTVPEVKRMDVVKEMSFEENTMNYQIQGNFEPNSFMYENVNHTWNPASGSGGINMINENPYPQPPDHP